MKAQCVIERESSAKHCGALVEKWADQSITVRFFNSVEEFAVLIGQEIVFKCRLAHIRKAGVDTIQIVHVDVVPGSRRPILEVDNPEFEFVLAQTPL